ncbi:MAG: hypothetical protein PHZ02_05700 [Desulfocapsaceae bacterium]|nr:hypothetical protein [Desulfocapsaceae bacterium]
MKGKSFFVNVFIVGPMETMQKENIRGGEEKILQEEVAWPGERGNAPYSGE